ncbi:dGTP triphosphohydrolase [Cribrihabitans pelagius]|uniref:dGTP triphosphohydrolase n=1 Tax=Cribrihabitans pelagius TaxID=1765746 RepID=UPI003B59666D
MQWNRLLNPGRLARPDFPEKPGRPAYLQDYDRILFSEPFRRLAQKTQVHPLHDHDHVHHRMIHSMETASVGRSLGAGVGTALAERGWIAAGQAPRLAGHVEAACLVHDIGNPPFGHSGEDSIGEWFAARFRAGSGVAGSVPEHLRAEFEHFEGNAQGLRITGRLQYARREGAMRLSYATLGAFMKYPCTRSMRDQAVAAGNGSYAGLKKFGVFESERALFEEIADALGLPEGPGGWRRRHPLAFLVEAADDICYRILDIEDAASMGDLERAEVAEALETIIGKQNDDRGLTLRDRIGLWRAYAIGQSIESAVEAFLAHYEPIMAGEFSAGLMEVSSKAEAFARLKNLSEQRIFTARRKTGLEVAGRQVLHAVLGHFHGLYGDLRDCSWDVEALQQRHGYWARLIRAVDLDLRGVEDEYSAMHSLADFVSGMTDRYAVKVRDMISGSVPQV